MDLERRAMLKSLGAGLAGSVAAPGAGEAHSPQRAPTPGAAQGAVPQGTPAGILDDHLRQTLASLAEMILPGSVAAGAVDLIERVTGVEPLSAQRRLLNAIGRFDQEARSVAGSRWLDLSEAARVELLTQAAATEPGQPMAPVWRRGQPLAFPPAAPLPPANLRDDLDFLKATIGTAYAATEGGMRAFGWTGRSSWGALPACTPTAPRPK